MKITHQYIVVVKGRFKILYQCSIKDKSAVFYITSGTSIKLCPNGIAFKLLENIKIDS